MTYAPDVDEVTQDTYDVDVAIVGSGFGGAVTALGLTEAGHRVVVLEQGRRLDEQDLLRARRDPRAYLWQPAAGLRGFFWQRIFRHMAVIGAAGVGGGSIVWASVLLEPAADSRIDERPAVVVSYAPDSRKLWPWVVDALRVLDAGTLVGMTMVDVPGARALGGTPFLLHRD